MAKPEKLPLLNDYIFKRTFTKEGTTGILKDLLEAILEVKITNLEVRNSEIPKELIEEKASILDIKAEINGNTVVDIEMQVSDEYNMKQRSTVYMCKNIATQIQKTEDYRTLKKSIVIIILNYILYKRGSYHHVAHMKFEKIKPNEYVDMGYKVEDENATEELEMHFIEMPKFIKKNPGVEGKLEQWLWLISGREEKIKMAEDKNEEVKKAGILVDEMSMDPKERELYEARLMAKYNYDSGMAGAREAGIEEGIIKGKKAGIAEGKKSKQMQIAKKMKEKGMKEEDIEEITGLSEEEIKGL